MPESGEGMEIKQATKRMSLEAMKEEAARERELKRHPPVQVSVDFQPLADQFEQIVEGQKDLSEAFKKDHKASLDQFLDLSQKQAEALAKSLGKVSPEVERERWVDAEYKQDFYTRFTPNLEPRFYTELPRKERELFDARWQLARAAFYKKSTASFPEKYRDNQDLALLGKEQMRRLYKMVGVQRMLEAYVAEITSPDSPFWRIKDAEGFEKFRVALRTRVLSRSKKFLEKFPELRIKKGDSEEEKKEKVRRIRFEARQADAVAWNWMWASNLVESADSRYSYRGEPPSNFPGVVMAGEYRHVLHPQEKFEGKSKRGHFWGVFGKWGVTQYREVEKEMETKGYNSNNDEVIFSPAPPSKYWTFSGVRRDLEVSDEKKGQEGGEVYEILTPECYPVTTTKSFWEETIVEVKGDGKTIKKPLLEFLEEGEAIPWEKEELKEDAWGIYMTTKFHKAFQLLEYFNPGKPMETQKPGATKEWANPLLELFVRLKPDGELKELAKQRDSKNNPKTYQTFPNLKAWAVYATYGGVKNVDKKQPAFNETLEEKFIIQQSLKHRNIKYFQRGEGLRIR